MLTRNEISPSSKFGPILFYSRPQTKFAKVMFLQVSVCPHGGACVVAWWGACMVARGGMHGCCRGVRGCSRGEGCAWDTTRYGDTINERAVRILLECILVLWIISTARLGVRFGLRLGFQTLWLHSIMQNMFPLTQIQIRIPFPQYLHSTGICV